MCFFWLVFCSRFAHTSIQLSTVKECTQAPLIQLLAKRMKVIASMVSCSYLRCDSTAGGHPLQTRMTLRHGFEWRQGPAYAGYRSYPSRSAAYHDVKGEVTPEIGPAAEAIFSLRMRINSLKGQKTKTGMKRKGGKS